MNVTFIRFKFSVQQLGSQRVKFQQKICFRSDRQNLRLKTTPTVAVSARLFRDGNFLRLYKNCQKAYIGILLKLIKRLPHNNEFKNLFYQYYSFRDFNRALFWKITSVNCIFNLKKLKNRKLLYYMRPERRQVLVLLWLKNIIKLRKKDFNNNTIDLYRPLLNFLCTNKDTNEVYALKLKMYKLRVVRG